MKSSNDLPSEADSIFPPGYHDQVVEIRERLKQINMQHPHELLEKGNTLTTKEAEALDMWNRLPPEVQEMFVERIERSADYVRRAESRKRKRWRRFSLAGAALALGCLPLNMMLIGGSAGMVPILVQAGAGSILGYLAARMRWGGEICALLFGVCFLLVEGSSVAVKSIAGGGLGSSMGPAGGLGAGMMFFSSMFLMIVLGYLLGMETHDEHMEV